MLGKLATWLRLLGCDVEYFPRMPDDELADRVARSGRVLLTRDTGLIRRRAVRENHFLVRGDSFRDQLRQVAERFSLDPYGRVLSRCLRCNELLAPIDRSDVRNRVPPYVYETQPGFRTCGRCGRIYWRGTHRENAVAEIREILGTRG
jgi:uncharacterized protein with PIN domain